MSRLFRLQKVNGENLLGNRSQEALNELEPVEPSPDFFLLLETRARDSEGWDARRLSWALEIEWAQFLDLVDSAKKECTATGMPVEEHFVAMYMLVHPNFGDAQVPSGWYGQRYDTIRLSNFACELMVRLSERSVPNGAAKQTS